MLNCKVAIYIPATINVNIAIDNKTQVKKACVFLSSLFGGCTAIDTSGYWIDNNSNLIKENTTFVYAFCNKKQLRKAKKSIINYAKNLCLEMQQETIAIEINNRLYFIN